MNDLNIIGIDPGNHLGLSVLTIDPKDLQIKNIFTKTITLDRLIETPIMAVRLNFLRNLVDDIYYSFRPLSVAIETSFLNIKYPKAVIQLSQYVGTIESRCIELDPTIKLFRYAPMYVKSVISGSGTAKKEDMSVAVKNNVELNKLVNVNLLSEHEVDATAIAYTSLLEFRNYWFYILSI